MMVCLASPPLPARYSFAKVRELGIWALAGASGRVFREVPGNPRCCPPVLRPLEPLRCADTLQPTELEYCSPFFSWLCPGTYRSDPPLTWGVFTTRVQRTACGSLNRRPGVLLRPLQTVECWIPCHQSVLFAKTNEKVTGASLRELFSGTSKPVDLEYLPVPSVLLDAVPRAHSRNLPSLSFKPSASAHSGPDTRRRREEQRNAERAVVPRGLPRWKLCACQNQGDASKDVRLLSLEPGLTGNLWDPPPGAQCLSVNSLLQGTQGQLQLSAFLFANLPAGRLQ